jgi:hypothetical protein
MSRDGKKVVECNYGTCNMPEVAVGENQVVTEVPPLGLVGRSRFSRHLIHILLNNIVKI